MDGGPNSGLTALTLTPGDTAALAARPILAVIEAVVFGLTTQMRMGSPSKIAAEIEMLDPLVHGEVGGEAGEGDGSGRHGVGAVRDAQSHARILFDEQYAGLLVAIDGDDRAGDVLHDLRRDAERRLVEQQEPRLRHQGAADHQHLLLAA